MSIRGLTALNGKTANKINIERRLLLPPNALFGRARSAQKIFYFEGMRPRCSSVKASPIRAIQAIQAGPYCRLNAIFWTDFPHVVSALEYHRRLDPIRPRHPEGLHGFCEDRMPQAAERTSADF